MSIWLGSLRIVSGGWNDQNLSNVDCIISQPVCRAQTGQTHLIALRDTGQCLAAHDGMLSCHRRRRNGQRHWSAAGNHQPLANMNCVIAQSVCSPQLRQSNIMTLGDH